MEMNYSQGFIDGYENDGYENHDCNTQYEIDWENGTKVRSIHLQIVFGLGSIDRELSIANFEEVNQKALEFLSQFVK